MSQTPDILQRIVSVKHEEVAAARARRSLHSLREEAETSATPPSPHAVLPPPCAPKWPLACPP